MRGKAVSGIMLTLLWISMLAFAFSIQPARASGTIYVRADGSVEPDTAPISSVDNVTYTFTDNIYEEIVVERDNIVVDGAGYTVQGADEGYGIYLLYRNNVTLKDVEVRDFRRGIYLHHSRNNVLSDNTACGNRYGIYISCSSGNDLSGNDASGNLFGIYLHHSSNNNLSNNTASGYHGIWLYDSSNNVLSDNTACGYYGIYLCSFSWNNVLSGNTATNSNYGIYLDASSGILSGNTAVSNFYGIYLYYSGGTLSGNTATDNYGGIQLKHSSWNVLSGNNASLNKIYGIRLYLSGLNVISGNTVSNNYDGIWLYESADTIISGNTVSSNNHCGIWSYFSCNCILFHNNFIDNTVQVSNYPEHWIHSWNDTYPSGGNYWSDYTGVDEFSGPDQDEVGADGIIDTPYIINGNNQDNYPLTKSYGGAHDIGITGITPSEISVQPGSMLDINITVLNYGFHTESFNLTAYANTSSIETKTSISLDARESITLEFSWNTTGVTEGMYTISAYASLVPNEIDTADNYFEDGVVTVVTPEYLTQKLIETIKTWKLPRGTENSFTSKLQEAILLLTKRHDNGAIHKLMDFINGVEALRDKGKLEDWQTDYLVSEAQRIIDLINA